jgi:hypothetical protein
MSTERCFCCSARAFAPARLGWVKCTWCDMQIREGHLERQDEMAKQLRALVHSDFAIDAKKMHWRPTHRTLRIAATRWGLWYNWGGGNPLDVMDPLKLVKPEPFSSFRKEKLSLVILAAAEGNALQEVLARHSAYFHDVVVVLDAERRATRFVKNIAFYTRPQNGDFSAQRNAGTGFSEGDWVFHLDTDEKLSDGFCTQLPALAGAAANAGLRAVGFPRRNFVDGDVSDLFPDVQYRLIKRDVRYENAVHERPDACHYPDQTIVSQHGTIDHFLEKGRIAERSAKYDELGQSPARHADDHALLRSFQP